MTFKHAYMKLIHSLLRSESKILDIWIATIWFVKIRMKLQIFILLQSFLGGSVSPLAFSS